VIQLTDEQLKADDALISGLRGNAVVQVLVGPAGTGKTTLMRHFADSAENLGWNIVLVAPTGKAAYRLKTLTGRRAGTLHSLLYSKVDDRDEENLKFYGERRQIEKGDLVICDEASMVGTKIHNDLLDQLVYGAKLLYVGDREQLPPVYRGDEKPPLDQLWGPNFSKPTAALETIHRQAAGNPIIKAATSVRQTGALPFMSIGTRFVKEKRSSLDRVSSWMVEKVKAESDAIVLCYPRRVRASVNRRVRSGLGYTDPIVVGDRLKIAMNNYDHGLMNGEIVTVTAVRPHKEDQLLITVQTIDGRISSAPVWTSLISESATAFFKKLEEKNISRRRRGEWFHVDYGYAITVHSAQGSEFDHVTFVQDRSIKWLRGKDRDECRRLIYTAVTRAAENLIIAEVPS
jgi:exodeoxyribonuclease-5